MTDKFVDIPSVYKGKWVYIEFIRPSESGKTNIYVVESKDSDDSLGEVRWHGPWRKYAFFPYGDTLYEQDCLGDISGFLRELMKERK